MKSNVGNGGSLYVDVENDIKSLSNTRKWNTMNGLYAVLIRDLVKSTGAIMIFPRCSVLK